MLAAGLSELRNENDANCTYEGDNNVLIQQTSNWLLNIWTTLLSGDKSCCDTPLGTIGFLKEADTILSEKFKLSRINEVFTHTRNSLFKLHFKHNIIINNLNLGRLRITFMF